MAQKSMRILEVWESCRISNAGVTLQDKGRRAGLLVNGHRTRPLLEKRLWPLGIVADERAMEAAKWMYVKLSAALSVHVKRHTKLKRRSGKLCASSAGLDGRG